MEKSVEDIIAEFNEMAAKKDEKMFINFIKNNKTELYVGKNCDGEMITLGIEQGVGLSLYTHQTNGWIRANEFTIEKDEIGYEYLNISEGYKKE